jgi:rRNA maturation endonuclease Nob1
MADQFYLQDSRDHAYVGDGLSFWGFKGAGYVTDLGKAEVFTIEQAQGHRDTDIPWPRDYIDARARVGVDCQYVTLSEALDRHPNAVEFYIQKPQAWNGNNLIWLCEDGVFTSDLSKAVRVARADTVNWIGKLGQTGGVVWPCAYIDERSRRLVERDDVSIKEALRGTGIKLAKPKKPREMMFNCHGCGRFISDRQRFQNDCLNCGADNRP